MGDWSKQVNLRLDEKLTGLKQRDLRFFRIEEFKRNIERVDRFSKNCPACEKEKLNISGIVAKIDEAIQVPGKSRREYDRIISRLSTHMQKVHGFFPPFYFTYLLSFFGMVAGLLLGYLLMIIFPAWDWMMLTLGFVAGLFAGYIWGNRKDGRIRTYKKLM
ncbi:MAG: hypothetical protein V2I31_05830 [Mariniphaga sp.]|jgi:hypothetical protein|nr:hypothetical protein [Mariniphaga sp.]